MAQVTFSEMLEQKLKGILPGAWARRETKLLAKLCWSDGSRFYPTYYTKGGAHGILVSKTGVPKKTYVDFQNLPEFEDTDHCWLDHSFVPRIIEGDIYEDRGLYRL